MAYTFGGKYKLDSEIGVGGCGSVYAGVHTIAGKEVAIKLEPAIPHHSHPSTHHAAASTPLQQESKIYKTLQGGPGVPWMMWSGKKDGWNVMVIDLLGPSLEDLFRRCNRHFSLKTVLLLADQMVSRTSGSFGRIHAGNVCLCGVHGITRLSLSCLLKIAVMLPCFNFPCLE